jgi:hypothetical protein
VPHSPLSGYPFLLQPLHDPIVRHVAAHHNNYAPPTTVDSSPYAGGNSTNAAKGVASGTASVYSSVYSSSGEGDGVVDDVSRSGNSDDGVVFNVSGLSVRVMTAADGTSYVYSGVQNSTLLDALRRNHTAGYNESVSVKDSEYAEFLKTSATASTDSATDSSLRNEDSHKKPLVEVTTPAQVLLRWSMQQNFIIITQPNSQSRLEENYNSMRIQPLRFEEMLLLNSIQHLVSTPLNTPVDL